MEEQVPQRTYSNEEMERILQRALEKRAGAMSHQQLVEVAKELGLSEHDIERAVVEESERGGYERAKQAWLQRQKSKFYEHLASYVGVNAFLFAINWFTSPNHLWFIYPLCGWGLGLAMDAVGTFFPNEKDIDKAVRKTLRKEEKKQLRS
jgi:hypothetical protein